MISVSRQFSIRRLFYRSVKTILFCIDFSILITVEVTYLLCSKAQLSIPFVVMLNNVHKQIYTYKVHEIHISIQNTQALYP